MSPNMAKIQYLIGIIMQRMNSFIDVLHTYIETT